MAKNDDAILADKVFALLNAWRNEGNIGLSLPFISWATQSDPLEVFELIEKYYRDYQFLYCNQTRMRVMRPITYWWDNHRRSIDNKYFVGRARGLLLRGTPSRHNRKWCPPTDEDYYFVSKVLNIRSLSLECRQNPKTKEVEFL